MVALPPERDADPRLVPSTANRTVPVGVPPDEVTAAVKVTESPMVEGFLLELTFVVVDTS
jgi:hypothetical protein